MNQFNVSILTTWSQDQLQEFLDACVRAANNSHHRGPGWKAPVELFTIKEEKMLYRVHVRQPASVFGKAGDWFWAGMRSEDSGTVTIFDRVTAEKVANDQRAMGLEAEVRPQEINLRGDTYHD